MNSKKNLKREQLDPSAIIERKAHGLEINEIIEKVRKAQKEDQYISEKYMQSSDLDFRWVNCNLQEKNLQLRRQLQKLSKILKKKQQFRAKVENTHLQILNFRDKLRNILSHSQTLQLSLVKLKESKKQIRKDSSTMKAQSCCCSRMRKDDSYNRQTVRYAEGRRSKNKGAQKCKQKDITIQKAEKEKEKEKQKEDSINRSEKKEDRETQTKMTSGDAIKSQKMLEQKKQHIQKLKQVISKQNQLISQYQRKLYEQAKVGKIAKVSELKASSYIKTCPSAGSIVRAEMLKK